MSSRTLFHVARRHLRWLLCFALLLPVAQWAGAAHAFTHAADGGRRSGPEPASHLQHCPVCPIAAAVAAGGLASSPSRWIADGNAGSGPLDVPRAAPVLITRGLPANRGPPASLPDR